MINLKVLKIFLFLAFVFFGSGLALAQNLNLEPEIESVFSLYPSKIEIELGPGETSIKSVQLVNNLGYDAVFDISVEDIGPSKNLNEPAFLYGDDRGPFAIFDLVELPYRSIAVKNGETKKITFQVKGSSSTDVAGRYGVVLFSVSQAGGDQANTKVVSRLGATLLLKSDGLENPSGYVHSFDVLGNAVRFYDKSKPVLGQVTFVNDGNIYLNTYGIVVAKNIFGKEVGFVELDPWYVLPGGIRLREFNFENNFKFGLYKLEARINRGYDDKIDYLTTRVLVLPSPLVSVVIVAILIGLLVWFVSKRKGFYNHD